MQLETKKDGKGDLTPLPLCMIKKPGGEKFFYHTVGADVGGSSSSVILIFGSFPFSCSSAGEIFPDLSDDSSTELIRSVLGFSISISRCFAASKSSFL